MPNDPSSEDGGAYVLAWLVRDNLVEAIADASRGIEDHGWRVIKQEEAKEVSRDTNPANTLEYFEQAQLDGQVWVFHTWPKDAPDAHHAD